MSRRALRLGIYLASFGLGRGALFGAPLVLANLLSPSAYGKLEFAHAVASVAAPLVALGTTAAVPLIVIRNARSGSWRAVVGHQFASTIGILLLAATVFAVHREVAPVLVALAVVALMLQGLWSVALKSAGRPERSLILDAGFWAVLAVASAAAYLFGVPSAIRWDWAVGGLATYVVVLLVWTANGLRKAARGDKDWRYSGTLKLGIPLLATGFLTLLATTSGRLGIGLLSSPEITAEYSVLFRATAVPILAHQILIVAGFRQIFEASDAALQRRLTGVVATVIGCVVLFWALNSLFAFVLGAAFIRALADHRVEAMLILIQCILWSAIALNDLVNSRAGAAGAVAKGTALYLLAVIPAVLFYLSRQPVTLSTYVPVHSSLMGGYFVTQITCMWREGIRLPSPWILALGAFAVLSAATQI